MTSHFEHKSPDFPFGARKHYYLLGSALVAVAIALFALRTATVRLAHCELFQGSASDANLTPEADDEVRIVFQRGWEATGRKSPAGRYAASWGRSSSATGQLRLIDLEAGLVVWELPYCNDARFSSDGRWLAACGGAEGLLLDLNTAQLHRHKSLRGSLIGFTPENDRLIVARSRLKGNPGPHDEPFWVFVVDREGRLLARFPIELISPDGARRPGG